MGRKPASVDVGAVFASYQDETIFSLMRESANIIETIYESLEAKNYEEIKDSQGQFVHHADLQHLSDIIHKSTLIVQRREKNTNALRLKIRSFLRNIFDNSTMRDSLLKIGRLSPVFTAFDSFAKQKCIKRMLKDCSLITAKELNHCLVETISTKQISNMSWPVGKSIVTVKSQNCTISS